MEHHRPPLSLALPIPPFLTLVARPADLSFLVRPAFFPKDVLLAIWIGFWDAVGLRFCGGAVLDSELDVLRKEVDETFRLLFKGTLLRASFPVAAPVASFISLSLFRASSESDARIGMGIEMGPFSVPFEIGRAPILDGPAPPAFFFLATRCSPWAFPFAFVRELARELPPLEELVMATL